MSDSPNKSQGLEQENEALRQKNEELEKYIATIKDAAVEFKRLSEEAAVNSLVDKAVSKIAKWIGISVAVSFTGLAGLYFALYKVAIDTTKDVVTTEFKKGENLKEIKESVTKSQDFNDKLIVALKSDREFIDNIAKSLPNLLTQQKDFLDILSTKVVNLPELVDRTKANIDTTVLQSLATQKTKIDQSINPELSDSLKQTLDSKRYFAIAASSEVEDDLRNPELIKSITSKRFDRSVHICKPKGSNKRSVLLVTKKAPAPIKLSLDDATKIQNELVAMPEFNTAYILPTDADEAKTQADNNIFFDTTQCQLVSGK